MILEACTNSVQSAINAQKGGANRVELCANLSQGGTTPSFGTIALARQYLTIDLYVLIRPREGDFLYTDIEFETIKKDIECCKQLGVDGVVVGLLNKDGGIDTARTKELVELAKPMDVTIHRAFDMVKNPSIALEQLIDLKVSRILTSGLQQAAIQGVKMLQSLQEQGKGRIKIMVGSGVRPNNIEQFLNIGITEFHLSGNDWVESQMEFRNPNLSFSGNSTVSDYLTKETKMETIQEVRQILDK